MHKKISGSSITVNANIVGELRVRVTDTAGKTLTGFDWQILTGDKIAHKINWSGALNELSDKPARLEFKLKFAQLFGFDIIE